MTSEAKRKTQLLLAAVSYALANCDEMCDALDSEEVPGYIRVDNENIEPPSDDELRALHAEIQIACRNTQ